MSKIIKYEVVTAYNAGTLESMVNIMIDEGWQPYGSLSILLSSERKLVDDKSRLIEQFVMSQPMVKYQKREVIDSD